MSRTLSIPAPMRLALVAGLALALAGAALAVAPGNHAHDAAAASKVSRPGSRIRQSPRRSSASQPYTAGTCGQRATARSTSASMISSARTGSGARAQDNIAPLPAERTAPAP